LLYREIKVIPAIIKESKTIHLIGFPEFLSGGSYMKSSTLSPK